MPISLFINESDEIVVVFYIAESIKTPGFVFADTDKNTLIRIGGDEIDPTAIESHQASFRTPSFGDTNRIMDSGVKMSESEMFTVSPNQIRLERICTLIKSWSFKDGSGGEVRPTRENVKKLHPVVALTLGMALEGQLRERGTL